MPRALLVCPEFPPSYWGYKYALDFVGKKAPMPPLGLLTVAAMFPDDYELRLVDMNVSPLTDDDVRWADLVLTSTMIVQAPSLTEVVRRCNRLDVPVVCGGPHPTTFHAEIAAAFAGERGVDHLVLGEAEEIFHTFLDDFRRGEAKREYRAPGMPDVTTTPLPRYDLLKMHAYGSMAVQFSRGCPFNCEFCDITKLYGRVPRTKTNEQVLAEFDIIHRLGWKGAVFIVDDNFIGNKRAAMSLLPEIARWQEAHGKPFALFTEASINVVQVPGMLEAMGKAGFDLMFIGIESPNAETLLKTVKSQNTSKKDDGATFLLRAVREIHAHGMEVAGGFIIGLDGDKEFDSHVTFIQDAGIPMAMTGLLTALKGTDLYSRMQREGRLLEDSSGNNTDARLNFVPELPAHHLLAEYQRVVTTLYQPTLTNYFERCWTLLQQLKPRAGWVRRFDWREAMALPRSFRRQVFSRQGPAYLRFMARVLRHKPRLFPEAVRLAIMGYHFEKITSQAMAAHSFRQYLDREMELLKDTLARFKRAQGVRMDSVARHAHEALQRVQARYERLHSDFRASVSDAVTAFRRSVEEHLAMIGCTLPVTTDALD